MLLLSLSLALVAPQNPVASPIAITGVSVVDPSQVPMRRDDQTVIVRAGRIESVGARGTTPVPRGATRIDGAGRFLLPGLWDMHVHFMNTGPNALPQYVAHGVTTVREMGGFLDSTRAWQRRMRAGALVGPRLLTPGTILESPRYLAGVVERSARSGGALARRVLPYRTAIRDSADARRVIDSLVTLGVDHVKFRTVASAEAYFAILREGKRVGLRVTGHIPGVVPLLTVADSGQDDVEHALGITDPSQRAAIAQRFAARGTWYAPTLAVTRAAATPADSADRLIFGREGTDGENRRAYASNWLLGWWRTQVDERLQDTTAVARERNRRAFEESLLDVREFAAAGVRFLAGTDAGSVLVYPGFSLHDELELLVGAGLTPQQALWSATAGPAEFTGRADSLGRIAPGYVADLVLLAADPTADIRNSRRIVGVVQGGVWRNRRALDALLASSRAR